MRHSRHPSQNPPLTVLVQLQAEPTDCRTAQVQADDVRSALAPLGDRHPQGSTKDLPTLPTPPRPARRRHLTRLLASPQRATMPRPTASPSRRPGRTPGEGPRPRRRDCRDCRRAAASAAAAWTRRLLAVILAQARLGPATPQRCRCPSHRRHRWRTPRPPSWLAPLPSRRRNSEKATSFRGPWWLLPLLRQTKATGDDPPWATENTKRPLATRLLVILIAGLGQRPLQLPCLSLSIPLPPRCTPRRRRTTSARGMLSPWAVEVCRPHRRRIQRHPHSRPSAPLRSANAKSQALKRILPAPPSLATSPSLLLRLDLAQRALWLDQDLSSLAIPCHLRPHPRYSSSSSPNHHDETQFHAQCAVWMRTMTKRAKELTRSSLWLPAALAHRASPQAARLKLAKPSLLPSPPRHGLPLCLRCRGPHLPLHHHHRRPPPWCASEAWATSATAEAAPATATARRRP